MDTIIGIDFGTSNSVVSVMENGVPKIIPNESGFNVTPSVISYNNKKLKVSSTGYDLVRSMKRKIGSNEQIVIGDTSFTPVELSSIIFQKMKKISEDYLEREIKKAVVTVPAYFNEVQRQAVRDSATIAGLEVVRIINEPTAAALAYKIDYLSTDQKIMVYDFGGGTFDVSILSVTEGIFEVIATAGSNDLGGRDFQKMIVEKMVKVFYERTGVSVRFDKSIMRRFYSEAERVKRDLSISKSVEVSVPYVTPYDNLYFTIKQEEFKEMSKHLIEKSELLVRDVLVSAGMGAKELDKVLLVGGTTRIPFIQESIENLTGIKPYKKLNPDEAVAKGAAIQAGIIGGSIRDLVLVDITPMALGVETVGGKYTTIIQKGSSLPTSSKKIFKTTVDRQKSIDIMVYQGDRLLAKYNNYIGKLTLDNLTPAPAGHIKIEVIFSLDINGMIKVAARDLVTGKTVLQRFDSPSLSNEDIIRMTKIAQLRRERDKKEIEETEILDTAYNTVNKAKKVLTQYYNSGDSELIDRLEKSIRNLEKAVSSLSMEFVPHYTRVVELSILSIVESD